MESGLSSSEVTEASGGDVATLDAFFERLAKAPAAILLLDYDGTLAPFRPERGEARPYPGVREAIARIDALRSTRVAIVTGRNAAEIPPLLGLELETFGCHGWERRARDGKTVPPALPPEATEALGSAIAWAESHGLAARVERKAAAGAFHWRGLAPAEADRLATEVESAWKPIASRGKLALTRFDGGLELRVLGRDKGDVVGDVLAESPAGAAIAYLGDDLTDEDAFRRLGPAGLGVLVREEWRATAARAWLVPPAALLDFLDRWAREARR